MEPSSREELIGWCLRKLGEPIIRVNVAKEQIDDQISDALSLWYECHYGATEKQYILYDTSSDEVDQGYITLPNDIISVMNVFRPNIMASGLTAVEYQYRLTEIYQLSSAYRYGELSYYYLNRMHMDLISYMFMPEKQYVFNALTHKLIIAGGLETTENVDGGTIIEVLRKIHGETDDADPTNTEVHNIWNDRWLKHYCTALIKQVWGSNLKKFQGVSLIGGVSINGQQLYEEATQERKGFEDRIIKSFRLKFKDSFLQNCASEVFEGYQDIDNIFYLLWELKNHEQIVGELLCKLVNEKRVEYFRSKGEPTSIVCENCGSGVLFVGHSYFICSSCNWDSVLTDTEPF